jgi:preprotein translocase subunit YajC
MTAHMGAIIVWTCLVFHVFFFFKKEIDKPKKHDAMMWKFYAGKETSGNGGLFPDF